MYVYNPGKTWVFSRYCKSRVASTYMHIHPLISKPTYIPEHPLTDIPTNLPTYITMHPLIHTYTIIHPPTYPPTYLHT